MRSTYSAFQLARAAGYTIRPVRTGGLVVREDLMLLDVGPDADELEIIRCAQHHLASPVVVRTRPSFAPAVSA